MPPELDEEVTMRPADGDGREDAIEQLAEKGAATYPAIWAQVMADRPNGPARPGEVTVPESIEEVTAWAGKEDSRRVELIYAPIFWVVLPVAALRSEEHTSELQSRGHLVCRLLLEKKKKDALLLIDSDDARYPNDAAMETLGAMVARTRTVGGVLLYAWRRDGLAETAREELGAVVS